MVKNPSAMWETRVQSLGQKDPLEKFMATHSSILTCRIPWTEKPGVQRVGHDWVTNTFYFLIMSDVEHLVTVCWPSVCLLCRNVCLGLLPLLDWVVCFYGIELHELLTYFGDYSFVSCFICQLLSPSLRVVFSSSL